MHRSSPKHPFPLHAALAVVSLLTMLCVGACSRSSHVTDSLLGPTRESADALAAKNPAGKGHHQPLPDVPTLSSPANGAVDVALNPTLSWNAATGAQNYRLQVATDAAFSAMVLDQAGNASTSAVVAGLAGSTHYFWRVSAKNPAGTSGFSAVFSFTTMAPPPVPMPDMPTLSSPTDGAIDVVLNPTLVWNAAANAADYRVQVSTAADFSGMVFDQSNIAATSVGISGLTAGTQYFWRVRATNTTGSSAFTAAFSFTTAAGASPPPPPPAPAQPTLSAPANGASNVVVNPTLVWNAATGATDYRLQVSTSSAFNATVVDQSGIVPTSAGISGLNAGTQYFWRVNARNASGTSAFSNTFSFTTAAAPPPPPPPPAQPTLSTPINGANNVVVNPTLVWSAAAGATDYRLQVSTSNAFNATVVDQAGITATSAGISGLNNSTQYFWRVNARNASGTSAFSNTFSFTTAPAPVSTDPCASLRGLGGNVTVTFASIPQFRVGRLRIELEGDVAAGTILAMGPCTTNNPPADQFISGTGTVTLSGSGASVVPGGGTLTFGPLLSPVPAEPGVVLVIDAAGNVLEIIWPALAGLPPGPPILRLQLASFTSAVQAGVTLNATMTFTARAPDGTTATFTASGTGMVVPPLK
jgi:hypothetical protein